MTTKIYRNTKNEGGFLGYLLLAIGCGAIMLGFEGCGGMEIGGRLGVYRVDEKQDSSRTYRQNPSLRCYFVNCEAPASESDESKGS